MRFLSILIAGLALTAAACSNDSIPPEKAITALEPASGPSRAEREAEGKVVAVAEYKVSPAKFIGIAVKGEGRVEEVISDRGFWMDADGQRVLGVVREDTPKREMIDINEGQRLSFTGLALRPDMMDQLTGTLEEDTRRAIQSEPAFIAVYWDDVNLSN